MKRFDVGCSNNLESNSKDEGYCGPLSSTRDGGKYVNISQAFGSQLTDCASFMPYGISSCPIPGVTIQALVNSNNKLAALGVFDKNRPSVGSGEVCIYTKFGQRIHLKDDGSIELSTDGASIKISGGGVAVTGRFTVNGVEF